jgi:hypothetical protein
MSPSYGLMVQPARSASKGSGLLALRAGARLKSTRRNSTYRLDWNGPSRSPAAFTAPSGHSPREP